jgi:glucose/arabinose dehydrogenase
LGTLRGKILRLNRDGSIPTDNPFYDTPGVRRETFAYGFRNPWRLGKRSSNQTYIVADVGQVKWEEINSLEAGGNYGWPTYEGPCPYNTNCEPALTDFGTTIPPIHHYHHSTGSERGSSVSGGVFAENSNYPAPYAGAYFYGDYGAGWVHGLTLDNTNQVTGRFDFDTLDGPVSFGGGPNGDIYVADIHAGLVYKYVFVP